MEDKSSEAVHWADRFADELLKRPEKRHVIATGTSISGVPHVGNASDVIRGDAIRKALNERGTEVELIWIADDSDPFRKIPAGMESLKGELGKPVHDVLDPEGDCHSNFVDHLVEPFLEDLKKFGVEPRRYSGRELYTSGAFTEEIRTALDNREKIREILNKFRELKLPEDYIPWSPICSECGRISTTRAVEWDGEKIVSYRCTGVDPTVQSKDLKDVTGCSHKGESDITRGEGKLPWRVEWAGRWRHFKVTCEPFGKEHATEGGSYDTSKLISREVYEWEPPVPVVYEFFTLNGEKISSSKGNIITLGQWLEIAEAEVLKHFMCKRLQKQRDINLSMIPNLTDEYDESENIYFKKTGGDPEKSRMYEFSQVDKPQYLNVPFTLCTELTQIPNLDLDGVRKKIDSLGYIDYDPRRLEARLDKARGWVNSGYAPDHMKFTLLDEVTDEVKGKLSDKQVEGLHLLATELDKQWTAKDLHKRIYDTARGIDLKPNDLFTAIYLVLIGKERGPRAASFILTLGRDHVQDRFNTV